MYKFVAFVVLVLAGALAVPITASALAASSFGAGDSRGSVVQNVTAARTGDLSHGELNSPGDGRLVDTGSGSGFSDSASVSVSKSASKSSSSNGALALTGSGAATSSAGSSVLSEGLSNGDSALPMIVVWGLIAVLMSIIVLLTVARIRHKDPTTV